MSTVKELAKKLGVADRTIRNYLNDGYALVWMDSKKIDLDKSVHSYVKYQSEKIRKMKVQQGRNLSGNSGNSGNSQEPKNGEEWKAETEKQRAIK